MNKKTFNFCYWSKSKSRLNETPQFCNYTQYCACCNKTVTAAFPAGVRATVQYGEVIRSWSVYYQNQHFIPEDRLQLPNLGLYGIQLALPVFADLLARLIYYEACENIVVAIEEKNKSKGGREKRRMI